MRKLGAFLITYPIIVTMYLILYQMGKVDILILNWITLISFSFVGIYMLIGMFIAGILLVNEK